MDRGPMRRIAPGDRRMPYAPASYGGHCCSRRALTAWKARWPIEVMIRIRAIACLLACAAALAGCEAPGNPRLATLRSPGGTYEVRLTGRVMRAYLFENRVRAEVYKNGVLHLPARLIYAAGLFDTSFDDRFGEPEWLAPTALHFPAEGASKALPSETLKVRNLAAQPFRSIRIETTREMFLILDLAAGAEMTFRMAPPRRLGDPRWFDVLVDSGSADALMRGHGTFSPPPEAGPPLAFIISVSSHGVRVAPAGDGRGV
jgi:hypothetical protein